MKKRSPGRSLAWSLCALGLIVLPSRQVQAQTPRAATPFYVELRDVDASAALAVIARGMGLNLVVGPYLPSGRTDLVGSFPSSGAFLEKAAMLMGAELTRLGSINVLHAACKPEMASSIPVLEERRLSMYFQHEYLQNLLEILHSSLPDTKVAQGARHRTMSLNIKNLPYQEVFEAVVYASGVQSKQDRPNQLSRQVGLPKCSALATSSAPDRKYRQLQRTNHCPYRVRNENLKPCDALEVFNLHELRPAGFIQINGQYFSIVESPDSVLNIVRAGDHLGKNHGKVLNISPEGLSLQEFIANDAHEYQDVRRMVAFGHRPSKSIGDTGNPMEEGSPLHQYTLALANLFAATQTTLQMADLCAAVPMEGAGSIKAATASWKARNANVLAEIDTHSSAYFNRMDSNVANPESSRETYLTQITDDLQAMVTRWGGIHGSKMMDYCKEQLKTMASPNQDIQTTHASELKVIRDCMASASCPAEDQVISTASPRKRD